MLYHIVGSYVGTGQERAIFVEAPSVVKARKMAARQGIENIKISRADPGKVPDGVTIVEVEVGGSFFDLNKRPVRTIAMGVVVGAAVWTGFMLVLQVLGFALFGR
jgi:hypothetical protein